MNKVTETAIDNAYQVTQGIVNKIEIITEDISDCSKYLYEHESEDYGYFYEVIMSDSISEIQRENLIKDALKKILYRNNYIAQIYFIDGAGKQYSSTRAPEKMVDGLRMKEWHERHYVSEKNRTSFIPTHEIGYYLNSPKRVFTYTRNIMNTKSLKLANSQILGTLYLDVDFECFQDIMDESGLVDGNQVLILDKVNGDVVYSNYEQKAISQDYGKIIRNLENVGQKFCIKTNQEYFIGTGMKDTNWVIIEKLPFSMLEKTYQSIIRSTAYLLLISIMLLAVLYLFNSRTTSKPIKILKETMDKVKEGNLGARAEICSNDELGILADGLNNMTEQLQKHIEKVYLSEIRQREAQIEALTTQIQPHYLYNTLDAIRMSAITNDDRDTALMLESLSSQMRYLLGDGRNLVSLKEELDSINKYFIIVKIRYENTVQLEINAEDNMLDYKIPRLTLQPIIENSVKYGISPKGGGTIGVYAEKKQECLEITIIDDGMGMEEDILSQVRERLANKEKLRESQGKGFPIGLKNIEDRIKLQFGEAYGITIESTLNLGTLIRCRLPVIMEEGDEE